MEKELVLNLIRNLALVEYMFQMNESKDNIV